MSSVSGNIILLDLGLAAPAMGSPSAILLAFDLPSFAQTKSNAFQSLSLSPSPVKLQSLDIPQIGTMPFIPGTQPEMQEFQGRENGLRAK